MPSTGHSLSYLSICSTSTPKFHSIPKYYSLKSELDSNWIVANSLRLPFKGTKTRFCKIICCSDNQSKNLRTCKNCKTQFDVALNHPLACRFHTAHFGGETKRKFESVYSGGTMNTPNSGQVLEYWHCCGSEDPFDPGCTSAPHSSYDD